MPLHPTLVGAAQESLTSLILARSTPWRMPGLKSRLTVLSAFMLMTYPGCMAGQTGKEDATRPACSSVLMLSAQKPKRGYSIKSYYSPRARPTTVGKVDIFLSPCPVARCRRSLRYSTRPVCIRTVLSYLFCLLSCSLPGRGALLPLLCKQYAEAWASHRAADFKCIGLKSSGRADSLCDIKLLRKARDL